MAIISGAITIGNDVIVVDTENSSIDALTGNDSVRGGDGNDTLNDEAGNDSLIGGLGNDSLPLLQYMRESSLTEEERLGFYPCMAHFILSFGDINKYMLREELTIKPYQQQVNNHTYEDDHH